MGLSAFNTKKGAQYKSKSVTKGEVHADRETWIVEADVVKQIGIPEGTTHAFRHGRVSVLQEGSVPDGLIKRWVGHSSSKRRASTVTLRGNSGSRSLRNRDK